MQNCKRKGKIPIYGIKKKKDAKIRKKVDKKSKFFSKTYCVFLRHTI
jgi:hypothetical protein